MAMISSYSVEMVNASESKVRICKWRRKGTPGLYDTWAETILETDNSLDDVAWYAKPCCVMLIFLLERIVPRDIIAVGMSGVCKCSCREQRHIDEVDNTRFIPIRYDFRS